MPGKRTIAVTRAVLSHKWTGTVYSRAEVRLHGRVIDAVCVAYHDDEKIEIHGVEVKTYRVDWLNEIAAPEKSGPGRRVCDLWWIATDSLDTVLPHEVPMGWGLILVNDDGLQIIKPARRGRHSRKLPRLFLAGFLDAGRRHNYENNVQNGRK